MQTLILQPWPAKSHANQPTNQTSEVTMKTDILSAWLDAKRAEDEARDKRIALESLITDELGCKEEGSQSHKLEGYRVTITGRINRTIDEAAWSAVSERVPANLSPIKYKPAIDNKGLKYLKDNEPAIYRIVAEAITAKPGKP